MAKIDWAAIKAEYISTTVSTRVLAEKYGASASSLMKRAASEKWSAERKKQGSKIEEKVKKKVASKIASDKADRLTRLLAIGDDLADQLHRSVGELDQHRVTHRTRTKTIKYGESDDKGKPYPTEEIVEDDERIETCIGPIDRAGAKQLASALKDLRDVMHIDADEKHDEDGNTLTIRFEGGENAEEASK